MRVAYIQDLDVFSQEGGAQQTDRTHFKEGIKRGHDIEMLVPGKQLSRGDVAIVSNAVSFPLEFFNTLGTYIWFAHDYFPICKYRLFYPMAQECGSCYLKERWLPILLKSKMVIWLSPLHRDSWLSLYPELKDIPYHLSPSPVDPGLFNDLRSSVFPRKGILSVESLAPFKGRDYVVKWAAEHPEEHITFIGGADYNLPLPENCEVVGYVPNSMMNEVYNRHEAFLHLPQSPSPFDRTCAEAYLAGCRIIGNDLIGALSYPWFKSREEVADHLRRSPTELWEAIEEVLR